jgi:hypothetical protein
VLMRAVWARACVQVRDGSVHTTIPYNANVTAAYADAVDPQYGRHEPYMHYHACHARERNKGLFNADQNVQDNRGATATRQVRTGRLGFGTALIAA